MSITHIPFYPSDWLAGTRGMTDAETGVYITLISRIYEMAGPIERDDNRLYRLCGSKSKISFLKSLDYLISEGKILETENGLYNEKASKVIQEVIEKSSKAKAAAQSRWGRKHNKINSCDYADASPEHMPQPCQPKPKPKDSTNVLSNARTKITNRSTQIPRSWADDPPTILSEKNLQHAINSGMTPQEASDETFKFRDWAEANGKTYKNWDAAWRTRCNNFLKFRGNQHAQGSDQLRIIARAAAGN